MLGSETEKWLLHSMVAIVIISVMPFFYLWKSLIRGLVLRAPGRLYSVITLSINMPHRKCQFYFQSCPTQTQHQFLPQEHLVLEQSLSLEEKKEKKIFCLGVEMKYEMRCLEREGKIKKEKKKKSQQRIYSRRQTCPGSLKGRQSIQAASHHGFSSWFS